MNTLNAKKAFSLTGFALLAGTAAEILVNLAMSPFVTKENMALLKEKAGPSVMMLLTYIPNIGFLFAFWLVMRMLPKDEWEGGKHGFGWLAGIFLTMYFVSSICNMLGIGISSLTGTGGGYGSMEIMDKAVSTGIAGAILLPVVLAPICEEIIFRKVMLDRLHRYGEKAAVVFSAVCFGFFHGNLVQFCFTVAVGFFLGYVYCKTRKIGITILMHMLINALSTGLLLLMPLFEDPDEKGAIALLAFALVYLLLMVLGLIALIRTVKNHSIRFDESSPECIPADNVFSTTWLNPGAALFAAFSIYFIVADLFNISFGA